MELKIIDGLFETKAVNADRRSVDAVMSTDALDRYLEVINPKAWVKRLSRFLSSPVLLKDHDHTKPIGHWENVRVTDEGLVGTAIFADTKDANERFALHNGGHVKGFSVGFIPHAWSFREQDVEGKTKRVRVFEDCELLECSSVAIPANPDALQRLLRSFSESTSDDEGMQTLAKAIASELRGVKAEDPTDKVIATIKEMLNAEPGGPLYQVLLDIADTWCLPGGPSESPAHGEPRGDVTPPPLAQSRGHPAADYIFGRS